LLLQHELLPNMQREPVEDWYDSWFDTPYYHILYRNHDDAEARLFIHNLVQFLPLLPEQKVLDLACGRGRHAVMLNELGMDVTGVDLSQNSIAFAKKQENSRLHFFVHDMLRVFQSESFDVVVNLFTSFGYFDEDEDNQRAISAAAQNLKPGGKLVLDFFNTPRIVRTLRPRYTQTVQGIDFHIKKKFTNGYLWKNIRFEDRGKHYQFQERVRAITHAEFAQCFQQAGLKIIAVLGNYEMHPFDLQTSDRLILVGEKV
jgi:SAM-dependent methyltransferase